MGKDLVACEKYMSRRQRQNEDPTLEIDVLLVIHRQIEDGLLG